MPVWEADSKSIMPLIATRREIDSTYALLKQLDQTWLNLFAKSRVNTDELSRIILVGSGDSWAAALIAAAWIESNSTLNCVARQTFEFLNLDLRRYGRECLIIVISASGRPSLVTDALTHAVNSNAQVLGLTNCSGSPFSLLADDMLYSGAQKKGMPTQSTSATLYLLMRLADVTNANLPRQSYFSEMNSAEFFEIQRNWSQKDRNAYRDNMVTLLGNHLTWGLALIGSNLLSCGPQIRANAYPIEEFHHSLRLNQVSVGEHFILLPSSQQELEMFIQTGLELLERGASIEIIDISPDTNQASHLFKVLQNLYEVSWHLAVDFVEQGGQRVCLQETL